MIDPRVGLLRAARRVVLVVGAGALGAVVCSAGVVLVAPSSVGTTGAGRGGSAVPLSPTARTLTTTEQRALTLLRRAAWAEAGVAYEGTKEFRSWSIWGHTTTTAIVTNVPGQGTTIRALGAGASRSMGVDTVLDLSDAGLANLSDTYRLQIVGATELLDRPVTLVDVVRPSGGYPVGQFWLDDRSGLAIQRDLFNSAGVLVRRTVFTVLTVTQAPAVATTPTPSPSTTADTCDDGLATADLDKLRAAGWNLPTELPGSLTQVCARQADATNAVQLSYSDGLFALSLFVQRGRLAAPAGFTRHDIGGAAVYLRCGLYRELIWASGGMVYTMVTDLPDETVSQVVAAVPAESTDAGVLARMNRGIRRVGSWVNPFS